MKKTLIVTALLLIVGAAQAQHFSAVGKTYRNPQRRWVDSVMSTLSLEQRIAQLMVVRVPLDMDDRATADFSRTMNGYGVGGVCFFVGTAERQVPQTRRLQRAASVPLLVCIDGEWGLGMRLKDMFSFPRNATFGRLPEAEGDSLVFRMGQEIGRQCRDMGIHVNFAPVVDINSNPKNPVIGTRSFGTDRERVARLGIMYMQGQQSQNVLATAKHFPGHGDTDRDSHLELPVISHTRPYIDTVDTYPFRRLIEAGVGGVMVAHLQVNALDSLRPSSLSPAVVDGLLRGEMGFQGLVVTDGLDMKGVTNTYRNGSESLAAIRAGNDILLLPPDVPAAIEAIKSAAVKDKAVAQLVDLHCRRVLEAKYRLVLPYVDVEPVVPDDERTAACRDLMADIAMASDPRIDSIVRVAIEAGAMPGCQVAVMHKGRLVLNRAYGSFTPDTKENIPVTPFTQYDLASLTKVCATTLAIMKLYEDGEIKLGDKLSKFLPYLEGTDKQNITVRQVMSHCAGLTAGLNPDVSFDRLPRDYDSVLLLAAASPSTGNNQYLYSDLGFMMLSDVVRRLTGQPLDDYVSEQFYEPMGLHLTTFRPKDDPGFSASDVAPTERDSLRAERMGYIWGTVHDPKAAAMGGVSGHAGLFSTASEVAALMQMLLDGGVYDGQRYLKAKTIETFTSRHFADRGNRRALGFDKQLFTPSRSGQVCPEASQASFGHTGFTGTMLWVDPEADLVYVFLSNRVCPTASPNRLAQMNIRTEIQSCIYNDLLGAGK